MYQTTLPPEDAVGHILRHNIADERGRKALPKGRRLSAADAIVLRKLGISAVPVAVFEPGDVHEDEAARRVAQAVCGEHVTATKPAASRVNLLAAIDGIVEVDVARLLRLNTIDGVTVATRPTHSLARARQRIATIKIIPFAVPEAALTQVNAVFEGGGPLVALRPLHALPVGVVLVGSAPARQRIEEGVYPAIKSRVEELGSWVCAVHYVATEEAEIAAGVAAVLNAGAALIVVAGETSIMDQDDVTPRGIQLAGGVVDHYGAPVEPGNLLLLASIAHNGATLPILGAPGCVRSRDVNIVDLLLPRLLAGERLGKADIITLGHGGLL